jgi:hypothetical protein
MPRNPNNPRQRRARTSEGTFKADDPATPDINEAWTDVAEATDLEPIKKSAGKPQIRKRVGRPKIGAVDKVQKPTFGVVRGVYS